MREKIALVVDDEPEICELFEEALEDRDITVWTCATAEEAAQRAGHFVIDLFFIDIFMPGKGGLWLIEDCQARHPEAEIVVMSGGFDSMSPEKTLRAAAKLDVKYRLMKPFVLDDILSIVDEVLSDRGMSKKLSDLAASKKLGLEFN